MCRKSRIGKNTVKTDAKCNTHRKTQKNICEMQSSTYFCTVQPAGWRTFFAIKHRRNRCESKSKVQLWVNKVPKLEFQHMPAKESHHPPARWQTQRLPPTTTTTRTRKHVRLPPRGVCRLFFGGFWSKAWKPRVLCGVRKEDDVSMFFHSSLVLFFGDVFAEVSQIPCFSSLMFVDFGGSLRSFCLQSLKNTSVFVLVVS